MNVLIAILSFSIFFVSLSQEAVASHAKNKDFEANPFIPYKAKKKIIPYVISNKHPIKKKLDAIFFHTRATQDEETFLRCGFIPISIRYCTYVYVASHPNFPGYLVKVYLDTEKREKMDQPSWKWLVWRCRGAKDLQIVIKKNKIKHFVVAKKWIYPLPASPAPPEDEQHTRHFALLLVTDMNLVSSEENLYAWSHIITKEHLDELYLIIRNAKGSSYRPDNISYTHQGTFAFIDTEYPSQGPDFKSIRPYLNSDMLAYWDELVNKGE